MMNMRVVRLFTIALIVGILNVSCYGDSNTKVEASAPGPPLKIYCTFLPIYIFASNVAMTRNNMSIEMIVSHDFKKGPGEYSPTESDLSGLSKANLLIVNGMGIDASLVEAARKANEQVTIIDASEGIESIESNGAVNPYIWMSPTCAIKMVRNIEKALIKVDPQGGKEIKKRADDYVLVLNKLTIENSLAGEKEHNEGSKPAAGGVMPALKIIAQGNFFDYLARDDYFQIVDRVGENEKLDEAKLKELAQSVKEHEADAVFLSSGRQYSKERGVSKSMPIYYLDVLLYGSGLLYPDFYEKAMSNNLKVVRHAHEAAGAGEPPTQK